jgi:uncharacterized protein YdhG (YjbR/CyaY superfamily)
MDNKKYSNIDEYISGYPEDVQVTLEKLRQVIKKAAPGAQEAISYGMPAFKLNRVLVYFAAQKSHIGFYPTSSGISAFKSELSSYDTSKGTVRFPFSRPLPFKLIEKIVKFRLNEVLGKSQQ